MEPSPPASMARMVIHEKKRYTRRLLGNPIEQNLILENRGISQMKIDTARSKLPVVYRTIEKQMNRNLILNARGIHPTTPTTPNLNRDIRYRRYPTCNLGYDGHNPPPMVRIKQPDPPNGDPHDWFSDHPFRSHLTLSNLPDNLFILEMADDPLANIKVPALADENGVIVVNSRGRSLRYFSFLPRYVSQKVPGYILEYWFRLDPRIEPSDIIDRMELKQGAKRSSLPQGNAISMRRQRFRTLLNAKSVQPGRIDPCRNELEYLSQLTSEQILLNTTMLVANGTFWIPRMSAFPVVICDYIDTGLPLTFFLAQGPNIIPSPRIELSILLRHRLQSQALSLGFGNREDNWTALDVDCQPSRWHDRGTRNKVTPTGKRKNYEREEDNKSNNVIKHKVVEIDGMTHDEWLASHRKRLESYGAASAKAPRRSRGPYNVGSSRAIGSGANDGVATSQFRSRSLRDTEPPSDDAEYEVGDTDEDEDEENYGTEPEPLLTSRHNNFADFFLPEARKMNPPQYPHFKERIAALQLHNQLRSEVSVRELTNRQYNNRHPYEPHTFPPRAFTPASFRHHQQLAPIGHSDFGSTDASESGHADDTDESGVSPKECASRNFPASSGNKNSTSESNISASPVRISVGKLSLRPEAPLFTAAMQFAREKSDGEEDSEVEVQAGPVAGGSTAGEKVTENGSGLVMLSQAAHVVDDTHGDTEDEDQNVPAGSGFGGSHGRMRFLLGRRGER